jgi:site-specific DNA recombinase
MRSSNSSDLQRDASIADQVRSCEARIDKEGWTLVATYTDHAISGSTRMRPGYQKLIEDARSGEFDIVVAEALDRLSRDQEDVAALHKHLSFSGMKLITISEGEISELHVGLKGTMNALFLKDLAQKTRRGLEGRVREGKSWFARMTRAGNRSTADERSTMPKHALYARSSRNSRLATLRAGSP